MTDKPNDGGPAFPIETTATPYASGLSIRDWFAGQALEPPESWLRMMREVDRARNPHNDSYKPSPRTDFQLVAEWKYAHADAMIAERNKP